ncbi:MAG TPA: hypothetical protein VGS58_13570 [Candidatus Sulfopaludibacter sp.]|nr:hypothetical protein [Candidatus Sulfopaludibacter sp.]
MPGPSIPPPIAQLGARPFSLYPAILNIRHNEWLYESATWSEVLVRNTGSNETISIPRRYVGDVSSVEAPVMIVGLLAELEYRAGAVCPAKRRVIQMPLAVNAAVSDAFHDEIVARPARARSGPAVVVGIRLEDGARSRIPKIVLGGVALGLAGCVLAISLFRGGLIASRAFYAPVAQQDLGLSPSDDYQSVIHSLGAPARDAWQSDAQGREFHILWYPRHRVYVVLMAEDALDARYIGTLDRYWRPVHAVILAGKGTSYAALASLRRF